MLRTSLRDLCPRLIKPLLRISPAFEFYYNSSMTELRQNAAYGTPVFIFMMSGRPLLGKLAHYLPPPIVAGSLLPEEKCATNPIGSEQRQCAFEVGHEIPLGLSGSLSDRPVVVVLRLLRVLLFYMFLDVTKKHSKRSHPSYTSTLLRRVAEFITRCPFAQPSLHGTGPGLLTACSFTGSLAHGSTLRCQA